MKSIVIPALLILLNTALSPVQAQSPAPVAGKDYIEIPNGSPLDPAEDMV